MARCSAGQGVWAMGLILVASMACKPTSTNTLKARSGHPAFPITAGAFHELGSTAADGPITCESCHNGAQSFTQFSCVSCHEHRQTGLDATGSAGMDDVHGGNANYIYESRACYTCHANGTAGDIPRDQHTQFPIQANSKHGMIGCSECHNASSKSVVTCTGCHRDNNGDALWDHDLAPMLAVHGTTMDHLGYRWDSAACLTCHDQSQVPGRLNHEPAFPIAAGTKHGDAATTCLDCHTSKQDRTQVECLTCHAQKDDNNGTGPRDVHGEARMLEKHDNGNLPGYVWESTSCFMCHQQSQVPGQVDHDRFLPIGPGSKHELNQTLDGTLVTCSTCHQVPNAPRDVSCTQCHTHAQDVLQPTHSAFPGYEWTNTACVFCHLGGQKKLDHTFFPVAPGTSHALDDFATAAVDGAKCVDCHSSKIDRKALTCTSCHDALTSVDDHGAEMSRHGYSYDSNACFTCHKTSQVPGVFDHEPIYKLLPPSGNGKHMALQCADCHSNKADRKNSLTCTACHDATSTADPRTVHGEPRMAQVHQGFPDYVWTPRVCIACHTDGTKQSALQNLNHIWFPIGAGLTHAVTSNGGDLECLSCHSTAGNFALPAIDCTSCHNTVDDLDGNGDREVHGAPRMATKHNGVDGYVWTSTECVGCHPTGDRSGIMNHDKFPIGATSAHTGIACTACHGAGAKSDVASLKCVTCHTTPPVNVNPTVAQIHHGVPNYPAAPTPVDCLRCHPNAEKVGPMDHAAFYPTGTGSKHASAAYMAMVGPTQTACSACHISRTDRTQNSCKECHLLIPATVLTPLTTHHSNNGTVKDPITTSAQCKMCHAPQPNPLNRTGPTVLIPQVAIHTGFSAGSAGGTGGQRHQGAKCLQCHGDLKACLASAACTGNASDPNPQVRTAMRTDKPYAADFSQYTCLVCHQHSKSGEESSHRGRSRGGYTFVSYGQSTLNGTTVNVSCGACH